VGAAGGGGGGLATIQWGVGQGGVVYVVQIHLCWVASHGQLRGNAGGGGYGGGVGGGRRQCGWGETLNVFARGGGRRERGGGRERGGAGGGSAVLGKTWSVMAVMARCETEKQWVLNEWGDGKSKGESHKRGGIEKLRGGERPTAEIESRVEKKLLV